MWGSFNMQDYYSPRKAPLKNKTKQFLAMIENLKNLPSFIMNILGGRGSGKTAQLMKYVGLISRALPDSPIVFFNVPDLFIELLIKYEVDYADRIHNIRNIKELDPIIKNHKNALLCIDETLINFNGKQSLKAEAVKFEKFLTISRHKGVFIIYNAQMKNMSKPLRGHTEMTFYKGNTKTQILESDEIFPKQYKKEIQRLYIHQDRSIFESSYAKFKNSKNYLIQQGYVKIDLYEICPWWTEELSKSYENNSVDAEFDEFEINVQKMKEFANHFLETFPTSKKGDISSATIRGWLRNDFPEQFYLMKKHVQGICDEIQYRLLKSKRDSKEKSKEKSGDLVVDAQNIKFKHNTFAEFIKDNTYDKDLAEMYYLFLKGIGQRDIAHSLEMSLTTVNQNLQEWRSKKMGYLFEIWFSNAFGGGKTGGNGNDPDFVHSSGRIFSLKCYFDRSKSLTFYQSKDFHPEFKKAQQNSTKYFAALLNPSWDDQIRFKLIDPQGDDKVLFKKTEKEIPIEILEIMEQQRLKDNFGNKEPISEES
jgi:hypothetical protein